MNIRLNWQLPTPGPRQRPIASTVLQARADSSLPWGTAVVVPAPGQTALFQDVAPGSWEYQAIVMDVDGKTSAPRFTSINLAFDPPSPVANLTAVEE